jgi:hypothetical protein
MHGNRAIFRIIAIAFIISVWSILTIIVFPKKQRSRISSNIQSAESEQQFGCTFKALATICLASRSEGLQKVEAKLYLLSRYCLFPLLCCCYILHVFGFRHSFRPAFAIMDLLQIKRNLHNGRFSGEEPYEKVRFQFTIMGY